MKLSPLLLCLIAFLPAVSAPAQEAALSAALSEASAGGVFVEYPSELILTRQENNQGTKLIFKKDTGFFAIEIEIYAVGVSPEQAVLLTVGGLREFCKGKQIAFTENQAREKIAGQVREGTEFIYTIKDIEYRRRYFAISTSRRTVLLMSSCPTSDDALMKTLFAPIAASIH